MELQLLCMRTLMVKSHKAHYKEEEEEEEEEEKEEDEETPANVLQTFQSFGRSLPVCSGEHVASD